MKVFPEGWFLLYLPSARYPSNLQSIKNSLVQLSSNTEAIAIGNRTSQNVQLL